MKEPFKGLSIVDLSTVLAGPSVGTFFAELGAKVIKVENPKTKGDVTRHWKLPSEDPESAVSAYFSSVNFGKEYHYEDLSSTEGKAAVLKLLQTADIVITNFKKGDDVKFGLDYTTLSQHNPGLIYANLSGFENEPGRLAYDVVLQAETGFMSMNGTPESGPIKMPVALIDVLAAHQLKEGILTALWQRVKDGRGAYVSCSLEATAISSLANQASNYLMAGHVAQRIGSLHPNIAPYGEIFRTKDGKDIVLAIGSDAQFASFCKLTGLDDLAQHENFIHNPERVKNRHQLSERIGEALKSKNCTEWMNLFLLAGIPAGTIRSIDEVLNGKTGRGMILEENIDGVPTSRISSTVFRITR